MNTEKFVDMIKLVVRDAAVEDTISILESPPGRSPERKIVALSNYYNNKSEEERMIINEIMSQAVDEAVFGFLCVLDGVRAIENGESKGTLSLTYKKDVEVVLNKDEDLHDFYNAV